MSRTARLWAVLLANLALVGGLVGVGVSAHSVGVWAESADDLADAAAIGVALLAMRLEAPTARRPGGFPRATRYAALVNAGWLLLLSVVVAAGALDRLAHGVHEVRGLPVLVVSAVAAAVMVAGALVLGGEIDENDDDAGGQLSLRAVLLDTAGDAAAAAGVAAAGAIIFVTGRNYWLDPAVALAISVVVGLHALRLVRRVRAALQL